MAVVGLGSIGLRHARNTRELGMEVIGFDPSASAREAAHAAQVGTAGSADEAIANADAVVIASPSGRHLDDLALALDNGCPALVEKPIGHDAVRAEALLSRANELGVPVGAVFNLRHRSVVRSLADVLPDRLGEFVWARFVSASWLPDWRPGTDYRQGYAADPDSGGVVFDVIHELDLALHLIGPGDVVSSVLGRSGRLELESEDTAEIVLRHVGGCLSSVHLNFASPVRRRALEISGTEGAVAADLRTGEIVWRNRAGDIVESGRVAIDPDAEYRDVLAGFVAAIAAGRSPDVDGAAGLAALRLACGAREAASAIV